MKIVSAKNLKDKLLSIQNLSNDFLINHESLLKQNQEKRKAIDAEIKVKTMQLFDILFLNQVNLIEQNKKIENFINSKSFELKTKQQNFSNKLNEIEERLTNLALVTDNQFEEISNETEAIKKNLDGLTKELNGIKYDYFFDPITSQDEDALAIGQIKMVFFKLKILFKYIIKRDYFLFLNSISSNMN